MILDDVEVDVGNSARIKRDMSNWLKVAETMYHGATEEQLLKMIKYEGYHRNRAYVIERLYSRFNALRARREKLEIREWRKTMKEQSRDTSSSR